MTRRGDRLLAFASRILSPRTVERVIEPIVADMRHECASAGDNRWRRRLALLSGYWGALKAITLSTSGNVVASAATWPVEERIALQRAVMVGGIAVVVLTMIMLGRIRPIPARADVDVHRLSALLVPGYLVVTLPLGLAVGILAALRGRRASARLYAACITAGVMCSLAALLLFGWIAPRSNQTFRTTFAGSPVARGLGELTLPELVERERASRAAGSIEQAKAAHRVRNARIYWSCGGIILALSAVGLSAGVARIRRT